MRNNVNFIERLTRTPSTCPCKVQGGDGDKNSDNFKCTLSNLQWFYAFSYKPYFWQQLIIQQA